MVFGKISRSMRNCLTSPRRRLNSSRSCVVSEFSHTADAASQFSRDSVMACHSVPCHSSVSQLVIAPEPGYPSLNTYRLPGSVGLVASSSTHQHGMDLLFPVEPVHQFRHHDRHIVSWWRLIDYLPGEGVHHIVLDLPILAGTRAAAANTFDQTSVDFSNQPLRDWADARKIFGYELECFPIVEQLLRIFRVGVRYGASLQQPPGLVQREARCDLLPTMSILIYAHPSFIFWAEHCPEPKRPGRISDALWTCRRSPPDSCRVWARGTEPSHGCKQ